MKYLLLFSNIAYLTGLPCFPFNSEEKAVLAEAGFFCRRGGNSSVTARAACVGDVQEEQIAQRALFCGLQEHKCINICMASEMGLATGWW